jgi:hypothetical protein
MKNDNEREILEGEINKITKKVMCHNHMALKGKSIEWLRNELLYLKKLYHM